NLGAGWEGRSGKTNSSSLPITKVYSPRLARRELLTFPNLMYYRDKSAASILKPQHQEQPLARRTSLLKSCPWSLRRKRRSLRFILNLLLPRPILGAMPPSLNQPA